MDYLLSISLRSLLLAAAAYAVIGILRMKSPAARHAVWTVAAAGMLFLAGASAALPTLPIRILAPRPQPRVLSLPSVPLAVTSSAAPRPSRPFPWVPAVYLTGVLAFAARLAYACGLTVRLVRRASPIARFAPERIFESPHIAVPLTVGRTILLPDSWAAWPPEKLDAVLVHERNHIRRADWSIALLAGLNRCLFWFHPLSWWLESRLKTLAEEACDDASLPHVSSRESYAQVLVEISAAMRGRPHRVDWEALAMAKGAEIRTRIERILDDTRPLAAPLTRSRWSLLALCAIPVIYVAAVARPARVRAQQTPPPAPPQAAAAEPAPREQAPASTTDLERARSVVAFLEQELARFQSEHMGDVPEQSSLGAELGAYQAQAAGANEALSRLREEKLTLEKQIQNLNTEHNYLVNGALADAKVRQLQQRITDVASQLQAASDVYTEASPQIRGLRARLESLQQELQSAREQSPNRGSLVDLEDTLGLLKLHLEGLNVSVDEKLQQLVELNHVIAQQQRMGNAPRLEHEYAELLRRLELARQALAEREASGTAAANGPRILTRTEPEYTDAARQARIEGKVELSVTIDTDGVARDIRVTRSLDPGLDQKAIDCIQSWRFRPATRDGKPVTAFATIDLTFRLQ